MGSVGKWRVLVGGKSHSLELCFEERPEACGSEEVWGATGLQLYCGGHGGSPLVATGRAWSTRQSRDLMLEQQGPSKGFKHLSDVLQFVMTC